MFEVASERGSFKREGREGLILLERRALENESRERARRTSSTSTRVASSVVGHVRAARSARARPKSFLKMKCYPDTKHMRFIYRKSTKDMMRGVPAYGT